MNNKKISTEEMYKWYCIDKKTIYNYIYYDDGSSFEEFHYDTYDSKLEIWKIRYNRYPFTTKLKFLNSIPSIIDKHDLIRKILNHKIDVNF